VDEDEDGELAIERQIVRKPASVYVCVQAASVAAVSCAARARVLCTFVQNTSSSTRVLPIALQLDGPASLGWA